MRIVASLLGSLVGLFTWRFRLGMSGLRLRFRGMLSALIILGGVGSALGYAVARRVLDDHGETTAQQDA